MWTKLWRQDLRQACHQKEDPGALTEEMGQGTTGSDWQILRWAPQAGS